MKREVRSLLDRLFVVHVLRWHGSPGVQPVRVRAERVLFERFASNCLPVAGGSDSFGQREGWRLLANFSLVNLA